jgi:[ribosomal protein S18]-alanine N-acetyltransferase
MKILKAKQENLETLFSLEQIIFAQEPYALSKALLHYHITKNELFCLYEKKTLIGYILWLQRKDFFRLYSLAIHPHFRRKGYANALLQYSFSHLKKKKHFSLEVRVSNTKAIHLYKKCGFTCKKILQNFYPDEDAYLMQKTLNETS